MDRLHQILSPRVLAPLVMLGIIAVVLAAWRILPAEPPADVPPLGLSTATPPAISSSEAPHVLPVQPEPASALAVPRPRAALRPVGFRAQEEAIAGPRLVAPQTASGSGAAAEPAFGEPAPLILPSDVRPTLPSPDPRDTGFPPVKREGQDGGTTPSVAPWAAGPPLGTAFEPARRSPRLEEIAREADGHTRRGFELASRRAHHSARAEFIQALRLVAQGLDVEHNTSTHSAALAAGLAAIDEAEDFLPTGSRLEAQLDLPGLIAGHRTPVLKGPQSRHLTPLEALETYFTFAQEQLATAAGDEVAGSIALHALGKLNAARGPQTPVAQPKAVTFYQAALVVCPANSLAANDLGVLLARAGRLEDARRVLAHSLSLSNDPTTRYNLDLVQASLRAAAASPGQPVGPALAGSPEKRPATSAAELVRWVDPEAFARSYEQTPDAHQPPPAQHAAPKRTDAAPPTAERAHSPGLWPAFLFGSSKDARR